MAEVEVRRTVSDFVNGAGLEERDLGHGVIEEIEGGMVRIPRPRLGRGQQGTFARPQLVAFDACDAKCSFWPPPCPYLCARVGHAEPWN